jgi:hypothetical protein
MADLIHVPAPLKATAHDAPPPRLSARDRAGLRARRLQAMREALMRVMEENARYEVTAAGRAALERP